MNCPAILTGDQFLVRVLAHLDCQARQLGTFGYQSLGEPGSLAAIVMTGLLTLFIALYGVRLLFGPGPGVRDIVVDILKIGIVLALAFSWPAWKTVVHDVVLDGPSEVAAALLSPGLAPEGSSLPSRLQAADNAMVALTAIGTGRQTGELLEDGSLGGSFAGSALRDEDAFGAARLVFLAGVIGSLALMRLGAGLLLALTPLAAGLLLFGMTRGIFSGWLRGLVLTVLGTIGATIVLAVELAIIEPWLADALEVRQLGYATPAAPIELLALTLAFAAVLFGMTWLAGRIAFTRGWQDPRELTVQLPERSAERHRTRAPAVQEVPVTNRAARISDSVATLVRHEERAEQQRLGYRNLGPGDSNGSARGTAGASSAAAPVRLGSSYRRSAHRRSTSGTRRDGLP